MKRIFVLSILGFALYSNLVSADTFGTGANQFTIDFVSISGDASSANGTYIGLNKPEGFTDPGHDYRMGIYEITNDQWSKFINSYGTVTGNLSAAYDESSYFTGINMPTNEVSWYEAAQFVNWLNTSTGHQAAYKFIGTQGQSDYIFTMWDLTDAGYNGSNPYRNSNAYYFLPTEAEWIKATYWNGITLQIYANASVGDLIGGMPDPTKWNYGGGQPWAVGSGAQELNGTYDMMGNAFEWIENPYWGGSYLPDSDRVIRGGSSYNTNSNLLLASRDATYPYDEYEVFGFRVASIPEPCTILLLGLGGLLVKKQ